MDKIKEGLNKIADKIEDRVEESLNKVEDELDNLDDGPVPEYSTGKQISIGMASGTILGSIFGRVSKGAAIVVGSTMIVATLANSYGLLDDFDKKSFNRDAREARRQLDRELRKSNLPSTNQIKTFFTKNKTLSYSGTGAFIASAAYFYK